MKLKPTFKITGAELILTREEVYDLMNFIDAAQVPEEFDKPTVKAICTALGDLVREDIGV